MTQWYTLEVACLRGLILNLLIVELLCLEVTSLKISLKLVVIPLTKCDFIK